MVWGMVQGWPQVINQLYTEVQKDREKSNAVYVEKRYRLHCANNTPKKEKGLFMIMNSLSKLTTLMTYCADKFLFIASMFYIWHGNAKILMKVFGIHVTPQL